MSEAIFKTAPHNPPHLFVANAIYMITASIYQGEHLLQAPRRKAEWCDAFYEAAGIYQWKIIAWVVLDNHYHVMVLSPKNAQTLSKFTGSLHKYSARQWNEQDGLNRRKVWWNYWDTCVRSERDYYSRLRYVFWNPVKHGLVEKPEDYSFSNYREFLARSQDVDFSGTDEVNDVPEF